MKHGPIAALFASRGEREAGTGPSGGGAHGSDFAPPAICQTIRLAAGRAPQERLATESGFRATNRTKEVLAGEHLLRVRYGGC